MKIDRIDIERWVRASPHRIGDDLTRKGEQQSWPFDHDYRLNLFGRKVLHTEHPGVVELELEHRVGTLARSALEHEAHLVIQWSELVCAHVDLYRDVRGVLLRTQSSRRVRI